MKNLPSDAAPWESTLTRKRWELLTPRQQRWELLKTWEDHARRAMRMEPARFRRLLLLQSDPPIRLREQLQPWQERDFAALDPAWQSLAGVSDVTSGSQRIIRRAYIERPRGHSKTTDMAVQVAWILLVATRQISGLAAAADLEQARLIKDAVQRLARENPELCRDLRFVEDGIRHPGTGSRLQILSSDVASSYGSLPDFVICDELCHWSNEGLWQSLFSSAAKKPDCLLTVLTNAGFGRGWQWEVRERARRSPAWYFSSLDGPHAPWITTEALEEQRAMLPTPAFERLWLNRWQHSEGEFITLQQAEACRDPVLSYRIEGRRNVQYVGAIDYAEKHDFTVGCVCHREGTRIVVDRMDVVRPTPQRPTPVQWVHDWIMEIARAFRSVRFVVDEYQLLHLVQLLESRYDIQRFRFGGGTGNHRLATLLHELIISRNVAWYPGCGEIDGESAQDDLFRRDDLETELAALQVRERSGGWLRFDHRRDRRHHDDRAFTLAAACLHLSESNPLPDLLHITPPTAAGDFFLP